MGQLLGLLVLLHTMAGRKVMETRFHRDIGQLRMDRSNNFRGDDDNACSVESEGSSENHDETN